MTARGKRAAILVALIAAASAPVAILLLERQCVVQEYTFTGPAGIAFVATHGDASLAAGCANGCQLDLVATVTDAEAALAPGAMVSEAADAAGVTMRELLEAMRGLTPVGRARDAGRGGQCPETRLKVTALQSGCIGGMTRSAPGRWTFTQCCEPSCECKPGKTCPVVPRSVLAGSGRFLSTVCATAASDYPAQCPAEEG